MRTLLQHINSLNSKERAIIASNLGFHNPMKASAKDIYSRMASYAGIELIFSQCSAEEIAILKLLSVSDLHYRDIEHTLHIPIQQIEKIAQSLTKKSIIYLLKNRQLLSNKLDRIYLFNEIRQHINLLDINNFQNYCKQIIKQLVINKNNDENLLNISDSAKRFFTLCIHRGGIVSVGYAIQTLGINKVFGIIDELVKNNVISIGHIVTSRFYSIIMVNPDYMSHKIMEKSNFINNHFMALIAMLDSYDCIISKGLFLTQEGNLRKSDFDKIMKTIQPISIHTTTSRLTHQQTAQLSLYLLYILKCLTISPINVNAILTPIKKNLLNPHQIIIQILSSLSTPEHQLFINPFNIKSDSLHEILHIVKKYNNSTVELFTYIYFITSLTELLFNSQLNIDDYYDTVEILTNNTIDFLAALGIVEIKNDRIALNDIGRSLVFHEKKSDIATQSIYINPDFSLVIPYHEVPSEVSYILLSFTEIISTDVTVYSKFSKTAMLHAIKRGMDPGVFITTLEQYAKNQFPQNIKFQLNEWIEHTPTITIQRGIILSSTTKGFIDELLHSQIKNAIVERLGKHHVMIHESQLDAIIKYAQKKEAVINIYLQ